RRAGRPVRALRRAVHEPRVLRAPERLQAARSARLADPLHRRGTGHVRGVVPRHRPGLPRPGWFAPARARQPWRYPAGARHHHRDAPDAPRGPRGRASGARGPQPGRYGCHVLSDRADGPAETRRVLSEPPASPAAEPRTGPYLIVVNAAAGAGRARARWPALESALRRRGVVFEAAFTSRSGDATRLAAESISRGYAGVVAVGGDGTINEVVNGLMATQERVRSDPVPLLG